jgi:predicted ABC-class ATPase
VGKFASLKDSYGLILKTVILKANVSAEKMIISFMPYSLFLYGEPARMLRFFVSLFSSPESLVQVMSQQDMKESIQEGDRIIIDEDGNASVNPLSPDVQRDFLQHVKTLKDI